MRSMQDLIDILADGQGEQVDRGDTIAHIFFSSSENRYPIRAYLV